ncbi:MAG: hypothetical protein ACOYO1_00940 [Bacteroidales bacterium]
MKTSILIFILSFSLLSVFAQNSCKKCNIEKVKDADIHLADLSYQIIFDFLCTFDTICQNYSEFYEYSNEILFKVLDKNPSLFIKAIRTEQLNKKIILSVLQDPLTDFKIQPIYDKVKALKTDQQLKTEFLNSLIIASQTNNQILNK